MAIIKKTGDLVEIDQIKPKTKTIAVFGHAKTLKPTELLFGPAEMRTMLETGSCLFPQYAPIVEVRSGVGWFRERDAIRRPTKPEPKPEIKKRGKRSA